MLKQQESRQKQKLLDIFDFRAQDKARTKQLVDEIDERIATLNSERYSLNLNKKKILASLEEDQILFKPDEARAPLLQRLVCFSKDRSRRIFNS